MDSNEFTFWLHGFFELQETNKLTIKQVKIIKDHLDLVFNKITPHRSENKKSKRVKIKIDQTDAIIEKRPRGFKQLDLSKLNTHKICSPVKC